MLSSFPFVGCTAICVLASHVRSSSLAPTQESLAMCLRNTNTTPGLLVRMLSPGLLQVPIQLQSLVSAREILHRLHVRTDRVDDGVELQPRVTRVSHATRPQRARNAHGTHTSTQVPSTKKANFNMPKRGRKKPFEGCFGGFHNGFCIGFGGSDYMGS